jgi:hypothetical protein
LKKKVENNKEVTEEVVNFLSKHDGNTRDHKKAKVEWETKTAEELEKETQAFEKWRPSCWLSFIALGKPEYSRPISQFQVGKMHCSSPNRQAAALGKKNRRLLDSKSSEEDGPPRSTNSKSNTVVFQIKRPEEDFTDILKAEAELLKEQIEMLTLDGSNTPELKKKRKELYDLMEEQVQAVRSKRQKISSSSSSSLLSTTFQTPTD